MTQGPLNPSQDVPSAGSQARPAEAPRPLDPSRETLATAREGAIHGALPLLAAGIAMADLIALRDVFAILRGDELLMIVGIATIFLAFGLGALMPVRLLGAGRAREIAYLFFAWLAAVAAPLGLILLRVFHSGVLRGGSLHTPIEAVLLTAMAAAPANFAAGLALALGLSHGPLAPGTRRNTLGLFAIGSLIGCALYTYLLGDTLPPLLVDLCIAIMLLTAAAVVSWRLGPTALIMSPLIWISLLVAVTISCSPLCGMLNFFTEKRMFGTSVVEIHVGATGIVTVLRRERDLYIEHNGITLLHKGSARRSAQVAELAHIPLLLHSEPQRVLVLGGSDPRLIEEVLREPVESVHHYLPDETVQAAFLSNAGYSGNQHDVENGRLVSQGGEFDVRGALKSVTDTYDVIIVDVPPPFNAFINRFYTRKFIEDMKALLRKNGILAVRVTRLEGADSVQQIIALSSFLRTFCHVFPNYILGGRDTTLCIGSRSADPLPLHFALLGQRRVDRGLQSAVGIKEDPGNPLLRPGLPRSNTTLATAPSNQELRPMTSFVDCLGWLVALPLGLRQKAMVLLRLDLEALAISLAVIGFIIVITSILSGKGAFLGTSVGLSAGQFISGALLSAVLLGDQCIYGTLFRDVGVLSMAFLMGVTSAAAIASARRNEPVRGGGFFVAALLLLLGIVGAFLPTVMGLVAQASESSIRLLNLFVTLPLCAALIGCAAGGLVPVAVRALPASPRGEPASPRGEPASPGGEPNVAGLPAEASQARAYRAERIVFAVSNVAGALGLLLGAVVFLPVLGIEQSCYFCALFASVSVVVLILARGGR